MSWLSLRLLLVHLLPGALPTLLFFTVLRKQVDLDILGDKANSIALYTFSSILMGIIIAHLKRRLIKPFFDRYNLTFITHRYRKWFSRPRDTAQNIIPLKEEHRRYELKLEEAVKLWLRVRLNTHPNIKAEIQGNKLLEKEYFDPTITSGDWWALLSLRKQNGLFYLEEYFSFYEFSPNFLVSLLITEVIAVSFWLVGYITGNALVWISVAFIIFFVLFHELTIFWVLATHRFLRKVILFSVLEDYEQDK